MISKNTFVFTSLLASLALLSSACKKESFVEIDGQYFTYQGEAYFPMMLNYVVEFYEVDGGAVLGPATYYFAPDDSTLFSEIGINRELDAHFELISQLGFNTVRICFDRVSGIDGDKHYPMGENKLKIKGDEEAIFTALGNFIHIAGKHGIRIMILTPPFVNDKILEGFIVKLLKRFSHNPNVFAYDFYNEPLYDANRRFLSKNDAYHLTKHWRKTMNKYAPNQLLCIGLAEPIEAMRWDPTVLDVDFIAFHTYNPLRVANEIYWYARFSGKPWMIGETGLPSENDSIPYELQSEFIRSVFQRTIDCGGAGFGWWEFKSADHLYFFEANHTGLLAQHGTTETASGAIVHGSLKPAALEIASLVNFKPQQYCKEMPNYYNMLGYSNYKAVGQVMSPDGNALEGAVIRGWNQHWTIAQNTFTDFNGTYTLYSNDIPVHYEISAPGYEMLKFDISPRYFPRNDSTSAEMDLPNRDLEYHGISYLTFLNNSSRDQSLNDMFNFEHMQFQQYQYLAKLDTVFLRPFVPTRK